MVELSHDSRPIIGRGPPLGATFITLAALSIAQQALLLLAVVAVQLGSALGVEQVGYDPDDPRGVDHEQAGERSRAAAIFSRLRRSSW